jgi:hypothetical protein
VNCRYHPVIANNIEHVFSKGNSASFTCWQYGDCASGGW